MKLLLKVFSKIGIFFLFSFFCKSLPPYVPFSEHQKITLNSGGMNRTFRIFIPKGREKEDLPIVFVLHGGGGSGDGMIYLTRMSDWAAQEGFIAVYPDGYKNRWNDGRRLSFSETDKRNTDDVLFFRDMVQFISTLHPIDRQSIHVTGLSNGGFMTQRLLCEASDLFASGYVVAALTSKNLPEFCIFQNPFSIGFLMGDKDDVVPISGGEVRIPYQQNSRWEKVYGGEVFSFEETLEFWAKGKNFELRKEETLTGGSFWKKNAIGYKQYSHRTFTGVVEGYRIEGGLHVWPYGFFYENEKNYGRVSEDFHATKMIVRFFQRTRKISIGDPFASL